MKYFGSDYLDARKRFLRAAWRLRAQTISYPNCEGSDEVPLYMDVAWHGPQKASHGLLVLSGTHGVEGFAGSAIQAAHMTRLTTRSDTHEVAVIYCHAVNPYGFHYLRRCNEDNVDVNRNFFREGADRPPNPEYGELAAWLCPPKWDRRSREKADRELKRYQSTHGLRKYLEVVAGGQTTHPTGLFYGGKTHSWSVKTLRRICHDCLSSLSHLVIIDIHTGLGERGVGDIRISSSPHSERYRRAKEWFGEVTNTQVGDPSDLRNSTNYQNTGGVTSGIEEQLGDGVVDMWVVLEFGTQPVESVLNALRAEAWLHQHGNANSKRGRRIKKKIRQAFCPKDKQWQQDVLTRGVDVIDLALKGLQRDHA